MREKTRTLRKCIYAVAVPAMLGMGAVYDPQLKFDAQVGTHYLQGQQIGRVE